MSEQRYRIGVIGLKMGRQWVDAASRLPELELLGVYDKRPDVAQEIASEYETQAFDSESAFFDSDMDIAVIATPDHFHVPHSVAALSSGKHAICEKPLALSVAECRKLIAAVRQYGRHFMVGQIARYAPGFRTARHLLDQGEIGELVFIESEYAHDYTRVPGVDNWRKDPEIRREGFIGGGCHALDVLRWMGGDPEEVFCYTNHKLLTDWPTHDTGVAVFKMPNGVIGKVFVSVGVKRPYTMRTVIYGTRGSIVCDNTSTHIEIFRQDVLPHSNSTQFTRIPVFTGGHHNDGTRCELEEFVEYLRQGKQPPTDVIEGTKTVAFGEAALLSARTGRPVRFDEVFSPEDL